MRPPKKRHTDEWAAENVVLPPKSAEPGKYRPQRVPYMVPIQRAFDDPRWRMIVFVMGSQMTKSTGVLNVIGKRMDDAPVPIIYFGPSRNFVENTIEPRLTEMLKSSTSLSAKTQWGKKNRKTLKIVSGAEIRLGWAGSAAELAGQPAGLVIVDERDRMDGDIKGEGDPVELARARGETYPGFCIGVTSTPLIGNVEAERHPDSGLWHWKVADPEDIDSATWKLWQEGTRHEWAWPCPHCGEFFIPRFSVLRFDSTSPATASRTAHLECPDCGMRIFDHSKAEMNARAVFVAPGQRVAPDGTVSGPELTGDTISFWVSGLASPFVSFGSRAADYVRAVRSGDMERLQTVVNTRLGELFRNAAGGQARAWEQIAALAQAYETGEVPYGVQRIALTVDVQKYGLYVVARGWGARYESWLLRAAFLPGETERPEVWNDLAELIDGGIDGEPFNIVLIDSGYRPGDKWRRPTNAIYDFCRRYPASKVRAIKGHDHLPTPIKTAQAAVDAKGKAAKWAGIMLHHLDSDFFKSWVMARIDWPAGEPGGWHVPSDVTEAYCRQVVAETRVVKPSGAAVWVRQNKDNHYLDAEMMQAAAAELMQVHALRPLPPPSDSKTASAGYSLPMPKATYADDPHL
ncbi:terminase gpA endonuclease subunit [Azospirillum sp. B21]|uniref:terminase gpA endonuclease subunit n=1 Tax=Azospirillum sp. B21 TaxID=2607496 RepID=UPI002494EE8D|nr:terminase gpA endonuclease subunit [Azospirillum sp. B21]